MSFTKFSVFIIVVCFCRDAFTQTASAQQTVVKSNVNSNNLAQETSQAHSQAQAKVMIASYDWDGKIPESRLVIIKNPFGSIRSRNHLEEKIYLHATYQEIGENALTPEFLINTVDGQLLIEVTYPESILDEKAQLRGRTDISVLFPDTVSIYAETDSGLIKIDKTASHVEAVSKSGEVNLTTTGLFSVTTVSGDVKLRLRGIKQAGDSKVISQTGNLRAEIFNDMDIALVAHTSREIIFNGENRDQSFDFNHGDLSVKVKLSTDTGNIQINVIEPPELETSVKPSNVTSVNVDLRDLPKSKMWKPGDPIYDRTDKKNNNK